MPGRTDPVRVEGAWPALVSKELFEAVRRGMKERAPVVQRPGRVGSKFLLSGLLRCGVCGRPYAGQGAKSGQFAYYICGTLYREGAGACTARYLNAPRVEEFIVRKVRERILTDETVTELVTLVAEEIDAMAGELGGRLKAVDAELTDVGSRLERLYEALETKQLTIEALSPRILSLRSRQDQLSAAREEAAGRLKQRRVELPTTAEIREYVADFRTFLQEGDVPGAEGPHPQLREGHRDLGRRGHADVHHPHAKRRSDLGNRLRFLISSSLAHLRGLEPLEGQVGAVACYGPSPPPNEHRIFRCYCPTRMRRPARAAKCGSRVAHRPAAWTSGTRTGGTGCRP